MKSDFFAIISRMKYINRWGLMRNTRNENLSEHCLDVAMFAHALVLIHNNCFNGNLNPEHAAMLALYHDASEIITGDMPTPVKYYNPEIRQAYAQAELAAKQRLVDYLPDCLKDDLSRFVNPEENQYSPFIKAADKLSALVKCIEEKCMGNNQFSDAEKSIRKALKELKMPECDMFIDLFIDAFSKTLDKQGK